MTDKAQALALFEPGDSQDVYEEEESSAAVAIRRQEGGEEVVEDIQSGPARIINIPAPHLPGGSIQITTNTLDPESMRSFREEISRRA